ncbi:MAG: hypothetical protein JNM24_02305 [Bdellovibrionaceae bacterium]|nr:hypothetical protein [Pseudobdellovibrionaceae bacterium]
MALQDMLNHREIQRELDQKMRSNWEGIPKNFNPRLNLNQPHGLQDLTHITLKGVNNYSNEVITLKELNFLYLYCFVKDFKFFRNYALATPQERKFFIFPNELKAFMRYSVIADLDELDFYVRKYESELCRYTEITGRTQLYSILD